MSTGILSSFMLSRSLQNSLVICIACCLAEFPCSRFLPIGKTPWRYFNKYTSGSGGAPGYAKCLLSNETEGFYAWGYTYTTGTVKCLSRPCVHVGQRSNQFQPQYVSRALYSASFNRNTTVAWCRTRTRYFHYSDGRCTGTTSGTHDIYRIACYKVH